MTLLLTLLVAQAATSPVLLYTETSSTYAPPQGCTWDSGAAPSIPTTGEPSAEVALSCQGAKDQARFALAPVALSKNDVSLRMRRGVTTTQLEVSITRSQPYPSHLRLRMPWFDAGLVSGPPESIPGGRQQRFVFRSMALDPYLYSADGADLFGTNLYWVASDDQTVTYPHDPSSGTERSDANALADAYINRWVLAPDLRRTGDPQQRSILISTGAPVLRDGEYELNVDHSVVRFVDMQSDLSSACKQRLNAQTRNCSLTLKRSSAGLSLRFGANMPFRPEVTLPLRTYITPTDDDPPKNLIIRSEGKCAYRFIPLTAAVAGLRSSRLLVRMDASPAGCPPPRSAALKNGAPDETTLTATVEPIGDQGHLGLTIENEIPTEWENSSALIEWPEEFAKAETAPIPVIVGPRVDRIQEIWRRSMLVGENSTLRAPAPPPLRVAGQKAISSDTESELRKSTSAGRIDLYGTNELAVGRKNFIRFADLPNVVEIEMDPSVDFDSCGSSPPTDAFHLCLLPLRARSEAARVGIRLTSPPWIAPLIDDIDGRAALLAVTGPVDAWGRRDLPITWSSVEQNFAIELSTSARLQCRSGGSTVTVASMSKTKAIDPDALEDCTVELDAYRADGKALAGSEILDLFGRQTIIIEFLRRPPNETRDDMTSAGHPNWTQDGRLVLTSEVASNRRVRTLERGIAIDIDLTDANRLEFADYEEFELVVRHDAAAYHKRPLLSFPESRAVFRVRTLPDGGIPVVDLFLVSDTLEEHGTGWRFYFTVPLQLSLVRLGANLGTAATRSSEVTGPERLGISSGIIFAVEPWNFDENLPAISYANPQFNVGLLTSIDRAWFDEPTPPSFSAVAGFGFRVWPQTLPDETVIESSLHLAIWGQVGVEPGSAREGAFAALLIGLGINLGSGGS